MARVNGYPPLKAERRSGKEPFTSGGRALGAHLLDFWKWSASDLVDNATRGVLAEYLVSLALGGAQRPRGSWDSYDLVSQSGTKIEIKSASPWQSWYQKKPSPLTFGIQPSLAWSEETGGFESEKRRQADVYVFAVLESPEKQQVDPLNLDQWTFYVLPTRVLEERVPKQKTIVLSHVLDIGARGCSFQELRSAIEDSV